MIELILVSHMNYCSWEQNSELEKVCVERDCTERVCAERVCAEGGCVEGGCVERGYGNRVFHFYVDHFCSGGSPDPDFYRAGRPENRILGHDPQDQGRNGCCRLLVF